MNIGSTVIASKTWRGRHPRCKGRGVGEVVNVTPCMNGDIFSVKWMSGKYDQLARDDLVEIHTEDETCDCTIYGVS